MKNLLIVAFGCILALACDKLTLKVDPVTANNITITSEDNLATLKGVCAVNYLVYLDANNTNISQGIRDAFNEFNNQGLSLKFTQVTTNGNLQVRFADQDAFDVTYTKGVYSVSNYTLSKIATNTIYLNRNFAWNSTTIKQVLMHTIGLMIGLSKSKDKASFMYPALSNAPLQITQTDKTDLQNLIPSSISGINIGISQNMVGAKFMTLAMNISNTNNAKFSKTGFCLSPTNILPTINDPKVEETRTESYYRAISGLTPNQTYYVRGFITNDCEIKYTNTLTIKTKQTDSWELVSNLPSEFQQRYESTVIASQDIYFTKAYIIGGQFVSNRIFTNEVWEYYPVAGTWKQKTAFPGKTRFGATGIYVNNKLYYGLGYNNGLLSDWWEYDIVTDKWTQKASQPDGGRTSGSSFVDGSNIILAGGSKYNGSTFSIVNSTYRYTTSTDVWSNLSNGTPLVSGVQYSFSPNDVPYLVIPNSTHQLYQLSANQWVYKTNMPFNLRNDAQYISSGNKAFCGLGYSGNTFFTDWYEYNPLSNVWIRKKDTPIPNRNTFKMMFRLGNDKVYFVGGFNASNNYINQIWEYNPE